MSNATIAILIRFDSGGDRFAGAGFAALTFDYRHLGDSHITQMNRLRGQHAVST
jgi:hypothetical protein